MRDWFGEFLDAIDKSQVRVMLWFCPKDDHSFRKELHDQPIPTVEWVDGVAYCLEPGCGRKSTDEGETMGKTIPEMMIEVRELNTEKGWRDAGKTFGDDIALLHSELSEALEAWRVRGVEDMTVPASDGELAKPEGVGAEFADVLIRLLDVADTYGLDLAAEYERKMKYNWTRSYRHGGKAI